MFFFTSLKTNYKLVITICSVLFILLTANHLYAAWSAPGSSPTGGNADAPINTGGTNQTKTGSFITDGNLGTNSGTLQFGAGQTLSSADSSMLRWNGTHDTVTQMLFRDAQDTVYGRVYGSGDGVNFGLLDGDGNWSYLARKDDRTEFRIDNTTRFQIWSNGNVGAQQYCDINGNNCVTPDNMGGGSLVCASVRVSRNDEGVWSRAFMGASSGSYSFNNVVSSSGLSGSAIQATCNISNGWIMTGCDGSSPSQYDGNRCRVSLQQRAAALNMRCCKM